MAISSLAHLSSALSTAQVVLGSAVGWFGLELTAHAVLRRLNPEAWAKRTEVQKRDLAVSVTGFIHAVVSSCLALHTVWNELPVIDERLQVSSPTGILCLQISLGYFIWDLFITPRYGYGLPFIVHAVLGITSTGIAQTGIVTNWTIRYILFEISTPALHVRQYYIQQKQTDSMAFFVADWCFRLTYVVVRSFYGSYLTYKTLTVVLPSAIYSTTEPDIVRHLVITISGISVVSFTLNQFWLYQMYQTARRRAAKTAKLHKE